MALAVGWSAGPVALVELCLAVVLWLVPWLCAVVVVAVGCCGVVAWLPPDLVKHQKIVIRRIGQF